MRRIWKQFWCKHKHPWYFFPYEQGYVHPTVGPTRIPGGGLKIWVCWECGKLLDIRNYRL